MTAAQLLDLILGQDRTSGLAHSPNTTEQECLALIRIALLDIADAIVLPTLETSSTVTTVVGQDWVAMPTDYERNLYLAATPSNMSVQFMPDLATLRAVYPGTSTGALQAVTLTGRTLWLWPTPSAAEVVTLCYAKIVDQPAELTDSVTCIPEQYQRDTIANFVLREIFDRTEDMMEGGKPNTSYYAVKYEEGLARLRRSIRRHNLGGASVRQVQVAGGRGYF